MQALLNTIKTTQPSGFFITGTDTDVGKTYVSCLITRAFIRAFPNKAISVRKPIASGCIKQFDESLLSEDALHLWHASKHSDPINTICPYLFEPAISPARAIQQSNQTLRIATLAQACHVPTGHFQLVEGAGGIYSPIASDGLNIDLAIKLALPIVLIVGNKLGCINHALLSIKAIENAGLDLVHIYMNDTHPSADKDNVTDLQKLIKTPITHILYNKS